MKPTSLRARLIGAVAAWALLALAVAGIAIFATFAASVQRDLVGDLSARLDQLTAALARGTAALEPELGDPRYRQPGGGLYFQVEATEEGQGPALRSRSLWDTELALPAPEPGADRLAELPGPDGQTLAALVRDVELPGEGGAKRELRIAAAEDVALRRRDVGEFGLQIALALASVGFCIVVAGWLMLETALQPVARLRREIAAIRAGRAEALAGTYPREFAPLVMEMNGMLDLLERTVKHQRERADDLAHGLKTPLAVLQATAGRLREAGDGSNAAALDLLSAEMAERIDFQMRLSHLRIRNDTRAFSSALDQALIRSVAVLRKTGRGADLYWRIDARMAEADIDPHDLMELVGTLLENAGRWARSEVEVTCLREGNTARFAIADDGPGLTEAEIAELGPRGRRLDESRSGSGLGIAIATEIVRLNAGRIALGRSQMGGLEVRVTLPAAGG